MVPHVHGGVDRQQEKAYPQQVAAAQQMWLAAHDEREGFAVAEFVVAPTLEPAKDGVEAFVGVAFQLAVNGDVTRVADFFGQISRVKNVLGLEVFVGLGALQVAHVNPHAEVFERLVDETSVARFVAGHEAHQGFDVGVGDVLLNLVVQNATREF